MKDKLVLSMSYIQKPKGACIEQFKPHSLTAILDSEKGFESEEEEKNLRLIFALLHDPITKQHKEDMKNIQHNT